MKRKFVQFFVFFLFICLFFIHETQAQSDEKKIFRNEINIDVSPLLRDGLSSQGFLYRRYVGNSALRVQVNLSQTRGDQNYYDENGELLYPNRDIRKSGAAYSLRVGWQKSIDFERVSMYGGMDVTGSYSSNSLIDHGLNEVEEIISRNDSRNAYLGAGLNPLFGVNFALNERFTISVQASSDFSVHKELSGSKIQSRSQEDIIKRDYDAYEVNAELLSGFGLFIGYKF